MPVGIFEIIYCYYRFLLADGVHLTKSKVAIELGYSYYAIQRRTYRAVDLSIMLPAPYRHKSHEWMRLTDFGAQLFYDILDFKEKVWVMPGAGVCLKEEARPSGVTYVFPKTMNRYSQFLRELEQRAASV